MGGQDIAFDEKFEVVKQKFVQLKRVCDADGNDVSVSPVNQTEEDALLHDLAMSLQNSLDGTPYPKLRSVTAAMKKMRRRAAQAIDGWAKGLLDFVIASDATIADNLLAIIRLVTQGAFGSLVMRCIRAARFVGVPKPDGTPRPISVSNFFMKLAGMVALQEGRDRLKPWRSAESGNVEGSKAIIHLSRRSWRVDTRLLNSI